MAKPGKKVEYVNRKAKFEYHFLETVEAGMQLTRIQARQRP